MLELAGSPYEIAVTKADSLTRPQPFEVKVLTSFILRLWRYVLSCRGLTSQMEAAGVVFIGNECCVA